MRPSEIVIHHSAGEDRPDMEWDEIRAWHTQPSPDGLGFSDIGYHAGVELIEHEYEILIGRPWDKRGAHCLGHNQVALGLCFVSDFNKYIPRPAALEAGARIAALWMRLFGIPLGKIYRHDTLNATDCPGRLFDLTAFLNLLQEAM